MGPVQWAPIWKEARRGRRFLEGQVIATFWKGGRNYGNGDIVDEAFRLLVKREDGKVGMVFTTPETYAEFVENGGGRIELDPDFSE